MSYERIWDDPETFVVRIPFLCFGLGSMNCYIIRNGGEVLIIDPGAAAPLASRALVFIAGEIGIDLARARFLLTHLHFDHAALLKQLVQPGSRIMLSHIAYANNPWNDYMCRREMLKALLTEEGVPIFAMKGLAAVRAEVRICDLPGCEYDLLSEGRLVHVGDFALRVIETPGHTDGHISLYSEDHRILISGDHILETFTPGVAMPLEGMDTFRDYLHSLSKVDLLDCDTVLPGHGRAFGGLSERCDDLRKRHERRLCEIFEIIARNPGLNGYHILRAIPWQDGIPIGDWERLSLFQRISMGAQTFSYLEFLVNIGEVVREKDDEGRHYRIA